MLTFALQVPDLSFVTTTAPLVFSSLSDQPVSRPPFCLLGHALGANLPLLTPSSSTRPCRSYLVALPVPARVINKIFRQIDAGTILLQPFLLRACLPLTLIQLLYPHIPALTGSSLDLSPFLSVLIPSTHRRRLTPDYIDPSALLPFRLPLPTFWTFLGHAFGNPRFITSFHVDYYFTTSYLLPFPLTFVPSVTFTPTISLTSYTISPQNGLSGLPPGGIILLLLNQMDLSYSAYVS
ncbi:hypothetical protein F4703DRAFT_1071914 [Phycomyces blakesleeanus]